MFQPGPRGSTSTVVPPDWGWDTLICVREVETSRRGLRITDLPRVSPSNYCVMSNRNFLDKTTVPYPCLDGVNKRTQERRDRIDHLGQTKRKRIRISLYQLDELMSRTERVCWESSSLTGLSICTPVSQPERFRGVGVGKLVVRTT